MTGDNALARVTRQDFRPDICWIACGREAPVGVDCRLPCLWRGSASNSLAPVVLLYRRGLSLRGPQDLREITETIEKRPARLLCASCLPLQKRGGRCPPCRPTICNADPQRRPTAVTDLTSPAGFCRARYFGKAAPPNGGKLRRTPVPVFCGADIPQRPTARRES